MREVRAEDSKIGLQVVISPESIFSCQAEGHIGKIISDVEYTFIGSKAFPYVEVEWYKNNKLIKINSYFLKVDGAISGDLLFLKPEQTEFEF